MKKAILSVLCFILVTVNAFAVDFVPTLLKLSAPATVQYDFEGNVLDIPVTVSGTRAGVIFCVFTKDQAEQHSALRNGFLGWHYVNKIDTCMYTSPLIHFDIGENEISWDGKDDDGNMVPSGEYTYYLWAYDNVGFKTKVYVAENVYPFRDGNIEEWGPDGEPLVNPLFVSKARKWTIGNNPADSTLLETTNLVLPEGFKRKERMQLDPFDHNYIYGFIGNDDTGNVGVWKFEWVPNGDAVIATDFGEDGKCILPVSGLGGSKNYRNIGVATDRNYLYSVFCMRNEPTIYFYYIDFEGYISSEYDMTDFWADPGELERGGNPTGHTNSAWVEDNRIYLNGHGSCLESAADPMAGLDDPDNFWVWHNNNGDYIGDHNYAPDAANPWACFDFNVGPYTYTFAADANHFAVTNAHDMGAISFALYAPDGTGIDYLAFIGEAAIRKYGQLFCDNGSSYDGIYTDNNSAGEETTNIGTWFVAHDSIKGVLTSQVAVEEGAPAAFAVAQNSPNPFNPTTTISFTTADAGNVSIDVFTVAGQKVDTVASEFMSAGSHSVTWDASGLSAGVYFYTVKTGEFSKTMKMTLLK